MSTNRLNEGPEDCRNRHIAKILGLSKDEVDEWKIRENVDESDGVVYAEVITFSERTPRSILDKAGAEKGEFHVVMCELFSDRR